MSEKNKVSKIKFTIKTEEDLKRVYDLLSDQGFGYQNSWKAHQSKVEHIINSENTLGIKVDSHVKDDNMKLKDYGIIGKNVKKYFSKFNSDDKIFEYINTFRLNHDARGKTPNCSRGEAKEIVEWVNFKNKYNLKDEFGCSDYIDVYNLDTNTIKLYFGESYNMYEFARFYELLFGEKCSEIEKTVGIWQDLGKIEIKYFQNGNVGVKGDLKKLKDYYYRDLKKSRHHSHIVVRYNKKTEILKKIER